MLNAAVRNSYQQIVRFPSSILLPDDRGTEHTLISIQEQITSAAGSLVMRCELYYQKE
jgi:hypothetical protein